MIIRVQGGRLREPEISILKLKTREKTRGYLKKIGGSADHPEELIR